MTAKSYLRGHPIEWVGSKEEGKWVYSDTQEATPTTGGEMRPCVKCGRTFAFEDVDPCLGILPGVRQACCGHRVPERAFIVFNNGLIITGFEVEQESVGEQ